MTSECMEVIICQLNGITFSLNVAQSDTIASVKTTLCTREGIPVSNQHLIYSNVELENKKTLADYNVNPNARLLWFFTGIKCYMTGRFYPVQS